MDALQTRLHTFHQESGARFTDFGGWHMPVSYPSGTIEEHLTTRRSAGLFDIDHMGQFIVAGPDAERFLDHQVSSRIIDLAPRFSRYGLLCREDGGIIDDVFVYRRDADYLVVVNASRRTVDLEWFRKQITSWNATVTDISAETYMVAVQGPRAVALCEAAFSADYAGPAGWLADMPRFGLTRFSWRNITIEAGRTGYTGEDGLELFFPDDAAELVWKRLIEAGHERGIDVAPVGLAARDTLRLEAGFPLYGHELTLEVSPAEARLLWACDLEGNWIGKDAVVRRKSAPENRMLIRFEMAGRGVAREGYPIVDGDGNEVGAVVSGGKGPSVDRFIGNAYVDARKPGASGRTADLFVLIRDVPVPITRHTGPFYRSSYRSITAAPVLLDRTAEYRDRHLGPREDDRREMLKKLGIASMQELIDRVVPADIRLKTPMTLPAPLSEADYLASIREIADKNRLFRSLIGAGYYDTIMPAVIRRTILENPSWYTQYTPYQAEISQGRLEALVNFQTMITELTAMEIANASMLDEATAAGEAMTLCFRARKAGNTATRFLVDDHVHPQTVAHLVTRSAPWNITVNVEPVDQWAIDGTVFGVLVQYPDTSGRVRDYSGLARAVHDAGALVSVAADPLALTLLNPPGKWGADVVVGNTQRFGVPMGYGGPHAAFFATLGKHKRIMPGRLIGVSTDPSGKPAMRLALQTREQHIRRDKATSNICTAQVLLAILASIYGVYHGPKGLTAIAERIHLLAVLLRDSLRESLRDPGGNTTPGRFTVAEGPLFDTVGVFVTDEQKTAIRARAEAAGFNLRYDRSGMVLISLDERSTAGEVARVVSFFTGVTTGSSEPAADRSALDSQTARLDLRFPPELERTGSFMTQEVFNTHRSESQILRYITGLQEKDLSLAHSMIPLGSCTMKLNAAAAMEPVSWPEFGALHPFVPADQAAGYTQLIEDLSCRLGEITGFPGCTIQPNSGAQGEYTGLMIVRAWHLSRGDAQRTVCLIPDAAHGTNPASAVMAGMEVVVVNSAPNGDIDIEDLRAKAEDAGDRLSALMVTYPSTHGVFEASIRTATQIIHLFGGQVYMDGANMNAQVGLTSPAHIGADVCHLNLHKTFAIPHGGGGPGVGPVLVAEHLKPFLPGTVSNPGVTGVLVGGPNGSASVLPISYAYIAMMGADGLRQASENAILNANYVAARLKPYYPVAYTGTEGFVAHECILDLRAIEDETGVTVEDVAKRLIDYGFHAPTMSWPLHGSLMVEPTESEDRAELDRFCDAMISIYDEIQEVRSGAVSVEQSALHHAPHTAADVTGEWNRAYTREKGAFPAPWLRERKFWPSVGRVDNVAGDRNLVCNCAPIESYREQTLQIGTWNPEGN